MTSIFVVVGLIFLSHCKVEGIRVTSDQVDTKVVTITTANGDIYECVDFYKQPAFKDPLLKNHKISKEVESKLFATSNVSGIGLKDGGCPLGTVPILKTNQSYDDQHDNFEDIMTPQYDPQEKDHCYAIVRTNTPEAKFHGASGSVVIYNPFIAGKQWSVARMRIENGRERMEVGWMVNNDLFHDFKTHLYIRFMGRYKGCFNLQCSGFVQVAKDVPIGYIPDFITVRGDKHQYSWNFAIEKHEFEGDWWLTIGADKYAIGYWPRNLFTILANSANRVEWGGEIYHPPGSGFRYPDMGYGSRPYYDTELADSYFNVTLADENFKVTPPPLGTIKYQNCKSRYEVLDEGYVSPQFGRVIYFGGPI